MAELIGRSRAVDILSEAARDEVEADLAYYQEAVEAAPGNLLAMEGLAEAFARLGASFRAARIFERLQRIYAAREDCALQRRAIEDRLSRLE